MDYSRASQGLCRFDESLLELPWLNVSDRAVHVTISKKIAPKSRRPSKQHRHFVSLPGANQSPFNTDSRFSTARKISHSVQLADLYRHSDHSESLSRFCSIPFPFFKETNKSIHSTRIVRVGRKQELLNQPDILTLPESSSHGGRALKRNSPLQRLRRVVRTSTDCD
jgi:hypothetical protein